MKAAITTSAKLPDDDRKYAKQIAEQSRIPYLDRGNDSLEKLWQEFDVLYLWTANGWFAETKDNGRFSFHPGTAMFRFKRWLQGEREPFLEATNLQGGDRIVDCTMGFGADALMASLQVGDEGKIIGLEKSAIPAFLFQQSQHIADLEHKELNAALRRIEFHHQDSLLYLTTLPDNSVDVIYFDPLFDQTIEESTNFASHKFIASKDQLSEEWIREAKRVATKRLVLKAHFKSPLFKLYGFKQLRRKSAKFHFGVLELHENTQRD